MKKGFTLVELLAVITILAIIALIAYPIVLNVIETSRKRAAVISAENYIRAVNYKISQEEVLGNTIPAGDYVIGENELDVDVRNAKNITGEYSIDNSVVVTAGLCVKKYSVEYSSGKAYLENAKNYCKEDFIFVEPEALILSELCTGTEAQQNELYANNTSFKIRTVDDLACFSKVTNKDKYFDGKIVYLVNDIDLTDRNSYDSYRATGYDADGDGNLDEELYTELTTGAGFRPIKNFKGEFYGFASTINNLMINRPSQNNVGLFARNEGKLVGLKIRNASIIGNNYVGILVGENSGGTYNGVNIKNVDIQGTVKGTNDVGGIVGYGIGFTRIFDAVFKGSVEGNDRVASIVGYSANGNNYAKGVVYNTTVKGNSNSAIVVSGGANVDAMVSSTSTLTGPLNGSNGTPYTVNDMTIFDRTLDTIIGGDNDSDGYYFDYDSSGNITLYSTDRKPLRNRLKGEGTIDKPYIIMSVSDWNMISSTIDDTPHYYSVGKDIDFTGKVYYPVGTNTNKFNGILMGNHHTISGISVTGYDNVGVFGYNIGTIQDIKFNNITIKGYNNNIGIIGANTGTLRGIVARNITVEGQDNVGALVGNNSGGTYNGVNIKNVDIKGTVKGRNNVGGLVGYGIGFTRIYDAVFSGSVEGNDRIAAAIGYSANGNNYVKGVVYDSTITGNSNSAIVVSGGANVEVMVSSTTTFIGTTNGYNGTSYTINDMTVFDRTLDTIISGDNDEDGYYFDYDADGNIMMYSTDERPIMNTLQGLGTQENPYLISNANEWNMIAGTVNSVPKYYSVIADIDFTGKVYYPIGTNVNNFNGIIDGNHHTISGVSITGYDNVGLIGYNTGTVKNIKFNNITIKGLNDNVGIIANNTGTIRGIVVRNTSVEGRSNVGVLVGNNGGGVYNGINIKNVDVQGASKGSNNIGGIVGYGNGFTRIFDFVFKGTVQGNDRIAAAIGYSANGNNYAKGVVYDSTITGNSNSAIVASGGANVEVMVSSTTTFIGTTNGYNGTSYTTNDMTIFDRTLDTVIGGDNDEDGYYFDYDTNGNITMYSTDERPIRNTLQGLGTQENPYLITSAEDWNMIAGTINSVPKYYRITADIDFTGKTFYQVGTNINKFNGIIDGNHHTISNVSVSGYDNVGLFGYSIGIIKNIKFNNITVSGNNNNVGIIGVNEGTVNGIVVRNTTVTGQSNVGVLVGNNGGGVYNGINIKNVDVQGTATGSNNVGGIVGYGNGFTRIFDFVFKGTVQGNDRIAAGIGYSVNGNNYTKGVVYDSTITGNSNSAIVASGGANVEVMVSSSTEFTGAYNGYHGTSYTANDMTVFDRVLDTYVGGDNDSDGYYFDYDANNNITLYSTDERPIQITLSGSGTSEDPYIISNADDWNKIAATINTTPKYYSVTNDISFTGKNYYPVGTNVNKFNGVIRGNHHTISNVSVSGYDNVGLFGYNTGTIQDLKFNNITISGNNNNVGIIGVNEGTIRGIIVRNANVTGQSNVGTLVGNNAGGVYNGTNIKNVDVQGTTSGSNNVGGIVGYGNGFTRIFDFVFKGTVQGNDRITAGIGYSVNGHNYIKGVVYDSTITGNSNSAIVATGGPSVEVMVLSTSFTGAYNGNHGTTFTDRTLAAVNGVLDTTIDGDNDSDGYYFTLINGNYELIPAN